LHHRAAQKLCDGAPQRKIASFGVAANFLKNIIIQGKRRTHAMMMMLFDYDVKQRNKASMVPS